MTSHDSANSAKSAISNVQKQSGHLTFKRIQSLGELKAAVADANAQDKTVMLDFFAEWCAACYEFEEKVFTDPAVIAALSNTVLLQADVTENNANDIELLKAYNVLGLPSIMFFDAQGNELPNYRATGFEDAVAFEKRINAAFKQ